MTTETALKMLLKLFHLPAFADNYEDVARKAEKEAITYERYLHELAQLEAYERHNRKIVQLLKQSRLPREKTLETLEQDRLPRKIRALLPTLCEGSFLSRAENILAFGNPGTGKTHLLCGIANELIKRGHAVLFTSAAMLVQNLLIAKRDLRLSQEIKKLDKFAAILIDDIGYVQQNREEMEVLFTLLAERYERRSVMITTNLVFSKWDQIFKDPMTTAAAVDRLVHHSVILELNLKRSYRAEMALENMRPKIDSEEGGGQMSDRPFPPMNERLSLKQTAGWFPAGDTFRKALALLSDGAFRLFAYLCLEADRRTGRLQTTHKELALALGKSKRAIGSYIAELEAREICHVNPGKNQFAHTTFEISDSYWPYRRSDDCSESPEQKAYVESVRACFLSLGCGGGKFGAAEAADARDLQRRGIPLTVIEEAMLLGACRKYGSWFEGRTSEPIQSLRYFDQLVAEIQREPLPAGYPEYLREKVKQLAALWCEAVKSTSEARKGEDHPPLRETIQ